MSNQNRDSADNWPTQQFPAGGQPPSQPGGPAGPGGLGGPGGSGPRRPGRATRWGIGLAAAAVLIGGGTAIALAAGGPAQLSLAGHAGTAGQGGTGAATPGSQAAVLNTVLSSADSPSSAEMAAASPTATQAASPAGTAHAHACAAIRQWVRAHRAAIRRWVRAHPRRALRRAARHSIAARRLRAVCRHRLARTRMLLRGIHGQFTFQTKKGIKTLAFERGTVESVASGTVTVRAADGTTWTWHLVSNTVIREGGKKATAASLAEGQRVFAGGPVVSGADDARLIVIRPAAGARSANPAS